MLLFFLTRDFIFFSVFAVSVRAAVKSKMSLPLSPLEKFPDSLLYTLQRKLLGQVSNLW